MGKSKHRFQFNSLFFCNAELFVMNPMYSKSKVYYLYMRSFLYNGSTSVCATQTGQSFNKPATFIATRSTASLTLKYLSPFGLAPYPFCTSSAVAYTSTFQIVYTAR
ncbi:hypothetical protein ABVK25_001170 [Lepraria finkii]|uniref:Uncharacterized protein n=1 Tax=Lepraria finkii TaxID=1340010 RepID=A0ABR4BM15_9LECA